MKTWSAKYKECKNCRTTRHPHIAKGFCKRCYPVQLRLQQLQRWDPSKPQSFLKDIPPSLRYLITTQNLDGFKSDAEKIIKSRLNDLRMREDKLKGMVTGIDIEHQLKNIARMIVPDRYNKRNKLYHGVASIIDQNFNGEQKKLIYSLLDKIDEGLPWKGIRYGQHAAEALVKAFIRRHTSSSTE